LADITSLEVEILTFSSFRRRQESSHFNGFWIPDQARHDDPVTFYKTVKIGSYEPAVSVKFVELVLLFRFFRRALKNRLTNQPTKRWNQETIVTRLNSGS
jgi:hypothetical protein